jgi:hypothetical protein
MLLDDLAFERLDRGFGRVLCLHVGLEDVEIVVEPFQVSLLDCGNALEDLLGIKDRIGAGEWVGCSGGGLAFNEGQPVDGNAEAHEIRSGELEIDFVAAVMNLDNLIDAASANRHLVADPWDGSGAAAFLRGLGAIKKVSRRPASDGWCCSSINTADRYDLVISR